MRQAITFAALAILVAAGWLTTAAAGGSQDTCCVCACGNNIGVGGATTSGFAASGICFDGVEQGECTDLCIGEGCVSDGIADVPCADVAGCSLSTMAPAASVGGIVLIGVALASLGIYATRRRTD